MAGIGARRRQSAADEALVRSLFEEHGRALWAYAALLLGDRQAAADVVQEVLVRAWRSPDVLVHRIHGKWSVRGWLFTATREVVMDRTSGRTGHAAEDAPPVSPPAPDRVVPLRRGAPDRPSPDASRPDAPRPDRPRPDRPRPDRAASDQRAPAVDPAVVLEALDQMTDQQRDVLVEIFFRGSSVARAAETLGAPEETVRSRAYHALRALRRDFGAARVLEGAAG